MAKLVGSHAGLWAPKHMLISAARGVLTPEGARGWVNSGRTQKPASCPSSFATLAVGNVIIYKRKDLALSVSSFLISLNLKGKACLLLPEDVRIPVIQVNLCLSGASPNRRFS